MKKFAWIIALLAALSLGFFACTEPDGTAYQPPRNVEEVAWKTIFDMQNSDEGTVAHGIQSLAEGEIAFPASGAGPIAPIVKAGNMPDHISSFKAVSAGGKIALEYVTVATWGPGFDLPTSAFGFRPGDVITIKGTATGTSVNLALNKNQGGNQEIIGTRISAAGDFTIEVELTGADISSILGNEQKVIRFEDRVGNTTVRITQIKIEGNRPINPVDLEAPEISLSGNTLSWDAVADSGGYRIYVDNEATPIATTPGATSVNLFTIFEEKERALGTYSIRVDAVGVTGVSRDSPKSDAVNYIYYYAVMTETGSGETQEVTHINPRFSNVPGATYGNSFTFNSINKVTIPANQQANFAYVYPTGVTGFDLADYDFVTLTVETTGTVSNFSYKSYPSTATDATRASGSLSSDAVSTIKVELRRTPQGFIFQKYTADANVLSVEITKAVFSKAARYDVAFDANGGSLLTSNTAYFVTGTAVGTFLPEPPTRDGYLFLGWSLNGTATLVDGSTVVSSALENAVLIAQWVQPVQRAPITVTFNDTGDTEVFGPTAMGISYIEDDGVTGYTANGVTGNISYGNSIARFMVDFGPAYLAEYESVTLTYKGEGGDVSSKKLHLLASGSEGAVTPWKSDGDLASIIVSAQPATAGQAFYQFGKDVTGTTAMDLEIPIVKPGALRGQIWFSFWISAGAINFSISDLTFVPKDIE